MLEVRVEEQVAEIGRLEHLKRFLSPQLAQLISHEGMKPLHPHRRRVTVVFIDLRGFTNFAESAEPEEMMEVLAEYHVEMGRLVTEHEGTLERFTGDGMMIVFNDPVEVLNPQERAVRMAVAMRETAAALRAKWARLGHDLNLGIGISEGYATLGLIGFEGRWDYAALGSVPNQAARLCGAAEGGQILVPDRFLTAIEGVVETERIGELQLKGFRRPVVTHNILRLRDSARGAPGTSDPGPRG
jgi:class 3 adenylate cyclase